MARVLLISGSTRRASSNSAFLRTVAASAPDDIETVVYDELDALPHFNPDLDVDPLPSEVSRLRDAIDASDGVLFCTPEYAGTLPGSFKNLLDWCVGGTVMTDKPVAWVNVAADLGYVQASVVEQACVHVAPDADQGAVAVAVLRDLLAAGGH
jgi:NAD(P)H-dependent FMN reductase